VSDLGQLLKKARSEKGISLEQLQETTKIQKRYLVAIEEGNFNLLPGNFYVRAFVKSYSEAVGLDPDDVMQLYRNVIPSSGAEPHIEPARNKRKPSFNTDRLSKWASTLLMWCFPLLIVGIIYFYFTNYYEPKPANPDNQKLTEQLEEEKIPAVEDNPPAPVDVPDELPEEIPEVEPEPEPEVTYVSTDGTTYIYNVANTEQIKVEIKIKEGSCWTWVKRDNNNGKVIVEKTYTKDQTQTWEVDHSIWLRFGYPGNVEIMVNGQLIDREKLKENNPWNLQLNLVNAAEEAPAETTETAG
jgi:cytoskeleton protein RodZ